MGTLRTRKAKDLSKVKDKGVGLQPRVWGAPDIRAKICQGLEQAGPKDGGPSRLPPRTPSLLCSVNKTTDPAPAGAQRGRPPVSGGAASLASDAMGLQTQPLSLPLVASS